jgi:hypothetical protein
MALVALNTRLDALIHGLDDEHRWLGIRKADGYRLQPDGSATGVSIPNLISLLETNAITFTTNTGTTTTLPRPREIIVFLSGDRAEKMRVTVYKATYRIRMSITRLAPLGAGINKWSESIDCHSTAQVLGIINTYQNVKNRWNGFLETLYANGFVNDLQPNKIFSNAIRHINAGFYIQAEISFEAAAAGYNFAYTLEHRKNSLHIPYKFAHSIHGFIEETIPELLVSADIPEKVAHLEQFSNKNGYTLTYNRRFQEYYVNITPELGVELQFTQSQDWGRGHSMLDTYASLKLITEHESTRQYIALGSNYLARFEQTIKTLLTRSD